MSEVTMIRLFLFVCILLVASGSIIGRNSQPRSHPFHQTPRVASSLVGATPREKLQALAAKMFALMNPTIDPCTDFFEYACGATTSADPYAFQQAEDVYVNNVIPLIASIENDPNSLAHRILTQCLRDLPGIVNVTSIPEVTSMLMAISNMNRSSFMDILGRLFALKVPHSFFFPTDILPWLLNATSVYHLYVSPMQDDGVDPTMIIAANSYYQFIPSNMDINYVIGVTSLISDLINNVVNDALAEYSQYAPLGLSGLLDKNIIVRASRKELSQLTGYDWDPFFAHFNPSANDFVLTVPDYYSNMSSLIDSLFMNPDTTLALKAIMAGRFFSSFRSVIPETVTNVTLSCLKSDFSILSDNLFADYTVKYLSLDTHTQVFKMLSNIITQFEINLDSIPWLDDYTKSNARIKASKFSINIGGPKDDPLPFIPIGEDFWDSYLTVTEAIILDSFVRVSQPVDRNNEPWNRDLFFVSPINAFYDPIQNGIFIESPIIAESFYIVDAPLFHKYGGIGVVTGHEMTHGFDNEGRFFDWYGDYYNWWSNQSAAQFETVKQCIINYYSDANYHEEYNQGNPIDGSVTQGENIADFGGVKFAYRAWQQALLNGEETFTEADIQAVFGMPSTKLFFLSYAQLWCQLPPSTTYPDVHSTSPMRVLGPLANSYYFQNAWQCPVGTTFHPQQLCTIW